MSNEPASPPSGAQSSTPGFNTIPSVSPSNTIEPLTLFIASDQCFTYICSTFDPRRILYRVSLPLKCPKHVIVGIEKFMYKLIHNTLISNPEDIPTPPKMSDPDLRGMTSYDEEDNVGLGKDANISERPSMVEMGEAANVNSSPRWIFYTRPTYDVRRPDLNPDGWSALGVWARSHKCFNKIASLSHSAITKDWKAKLDEGRDDWKVEAGSGLMDKITNKKQDMWTWRDGEGEVLAVEQETEIPVDGEPEPLLRIELDVKTALEDRKLDFLVALWVGRVAAEFETLKTPLSWNKGELPIVWLYKYDINGEIVQLNAFYKLFKYMVPNPK
ncbi:hypothetical protein CC78DRAFT_573538 [Lojkania enalia]|uniref:Uncharacterized protein n=1 Tax=Lojkania enalia TaxID=147567 RepID=A0A9P4TRZ9_9PLEO|nr:hypothetical protein CC78DRAFT_573538 [Didymosphaeria enalia]